MARPPVKIVNNGRACTMCNKFQDISQFYRDAKGTPRAWCRQCCILVTKKRNNTPEGRMKEAARRKTPKGRRLRRFERVKSRYGLSRDEYINLEEKHAGRCAICNDEFDKGIPSVDHDHKTGKVRGLLCSACNKGLGLFRDSVELMYRAVAYVKSYGTNHG